MVKRFASQSRVRFALLLASLAAVWATGLAPGRLEAVILNSGHGNTSPPPDDPGFFNVSDGGASMVYLGDSWVLTAAHAVPFNTPGPLRFAGHEYPVIPNTAVLLHNPAGMDLSATTDLQMFRINGAPDLPSLTLSSSPPPVGAEVTMIGRGRKREDSLVQWDVQKNGTTWVWKETPAGGDYRGYRVPSDGIQETRWGINRVANEDPIVGESDPGHTTAVEVETGSIRRHVVSLLTVWDESGAAPHEAQAVPGDSGGGVFYKRGGRWELAGIMNAVLTFPNHPRASAIYGQATTLADLSVYRDEILSITSNPNYSIVGDVNLDGVVNGDGTGPPESDDLTAFRGGWLTHHAVANVESWKLGDLNQDAMTDLVDFKLLRNAHPAAAELAPALGVAVAAIPEPAAWLLLLLGFAAAILVRGPLRSRP